MSAVADLDDHRATRGGQENGMGDDEDEAGRSAAERGEDEAPVGEASDGQQELLFEFEERGKKVTLGSLLKRGVPVEYKFKLGGMGVKGKGNMGLIGFTEPDITLVVPCLAGKVTIDPTYDDDGAVKKITVTAAVKPKMVYDAKSPEALALLGMAPQE